MEYVVSYMLLGLHFGWIDDVFVMLQMKGEVISEQNAFFNLRGNNYFSYLYCWLYNHIDKFNWYGVFLTLYSFFCILNINFILFHLVEKVNMAGRSLFILLSLSFFGAYVVENVYLLNFTRIAILLTYSSIICLVIVFLSYKDSPYRKWLLALFFIFGFIGWNCRLPAVLIFLPTVTLFFFLIFENKQRFMAIGALVLYTGLYLSLAYLFLSPVNRAEFKSINYTEKYVHNILNAFNGKEVSEFDNPRDSIKALSLYRWQFSDRDSVLNQDFLDQLGSNNPFKLSVLDNWQENLKDEIFKARYYYNNSYMPDMNWYLKSVCMLLTILGLPLLLLFYLSVDSSSFFKSFLFGAGIFIFVIFITIFFKMEDRALTPLLIFSFLASWLIANQNKKSLQKNAVYFIIFIFAMVAVHRVSGYRQISKQRTADLDIKGKIRSNIKKFYGDKIVFFDLYSLTMLETSPIWNEKFPDNWTTGLEMFNLHNVEHHKKIEKVVGCLDWPCFFQEVSKNPDKYLFFYTNERIVITHAYHKIVYDYDLWFRKESDRMLINNMHNSFLWFPIGLGYYSVDTTIGHRLQPHQVMPNDEYYMQDN